MGHNFFYLLDHGYLKFVESWGSDERIVEAARMSTDKGFTGWGPKHPVTCLARAFGATEKDCTCGRSEAGDEKLLRYLYEHKHHTPFEMAGLTIEVQAPIMVFREWHRHRTQSYNELSARYTPLPPIDYMPTLQRLLPSVSVDGVSHTPLSTTGTNKQAGAIKDADPLTEESALQWMEELAALYEHARRVYASGLRKGVPKELARLPVTVGRYSRMRASANLRNWLAFLTLRSTDKGPRAQYEIRVYADALLAVVREVFPRTAALFDAG